MASCGATILARSAAIAAVVIIGGVLSACARRQANSGQPDDDRLLVTALRKWEADIQAKRVGTAEPPVDKGEFRATPSNSTQALMEAAQLGDSKLIESMLARGADQKTLNDALVLTARSEPLAADVKSQQEVDLRYASTARVLLREGPS